VKAERVAIFLTILKKQEKKITSENSSSLINVSRESKNISDQEVLQQKVIIEDLPDGSYGFCKQPTSKKVTSDLEGWCFIFRKNQNHIVGLYTLWLPSDYARICINGTVENNKITGSGYEIIEGYSKPITTHDIAKLTERMLADKGIWDNSEIEGGNNLKVNILNLYSTEKYPNGQHYAWIRYQDLQLNLNGFERRNLGKNFPQERCPN
jgi:hypothetical protein